MNVQKKVILVTGGAGGLGAEMVEVLASNGARVYILDLDSAKGEALAKRIVEEGLFAAFLKLDLTSEEAWKQTISLIMEREGRIDVLVNNAGINIRKPIEEMSMGEFSTMMNVNVGSVFLGTKSV
ncbi:MAG: SDR family NAD(P)-dependent oxidoreductase, partial [Sphaerochaeta sp.]|nr:SDR family NAD(P)-dependent oxidoreductase [Sphaerochaeta sp.]